MSIIENVQPAVKKETGKVAAITGIGLILMWIVFEMCIRDRSKRIIRM